jgi:hypothetical protein
MHAVAMVLRLVDKTLEGCAVDDVLAVLCEWLSRRVMGDAYLVAHGVPEGRAALTDRQVRVVPVGRWLKCTTSTIKVATSSLRILHRIYMVYSREILIEN